MAIGVKVAKGSSQKARARRHFRVRKKITGTTARPRLVVSRSTRHLFVQIVDDSIGQTIVSASTMEDALRKDSSSDKSAKAKILGQSIAERAKEKGITFKVESPTRFHISGIDKQLVGEVTAKIQKLRKSDPYKGKGLHLDGERIRRKQGKTGKK